MLASVLGRVGTLDDALTHRANAVVRRRTRVRGGTRLLAERLATIEVGLMGALLFTGRRRSVARMLMAVSTVYVASEGLGLLWPRRRPFEELPDVQRLVEHSPGRSFPSRHVASGLAMAIVGYRAHPVLGAAMACVAMLLGASRVAAGLHYASDVAAGVILGGLVGRLAATRRSCSG